MVLGGIIHEHKKLLFLSLCISANVLITKTNVYAVLGKDLKSVPLAPPYLSVHGVGGTNLTLYLGNQAATQPHT
jgi:hypothetical protein